MKREVTVTITNEEYPDWSYMEQWDTPEKYYGEVPQCSHGVDMVYSEGHTFKSNLDRCEDCYDHEETKEANLDSKEGGIMLRLKRGAPKDSSDPKDREPVAFDDYMRNEGDLNNHVMLFAYASVKCPNCGEVDKYAASLGNIDMMSSDNYAFGTFTPEQVAQLKDTDYMKEVATDLLQEVKNYPPHCKRVRLYMPKGKPVTLNVDLKSPLAASNAWKVTPKKKAPRAK